MSCVNNLPTALYWSNCPVSQRGYLELCLPLHSLILIPCSLCSLTTRPSALQPTSRESICAPAEAVTVTLKEDRAETRLHRTNVTALRFGYKTPAILSLGEFGGWTEIWILSFFKAMQWKEERENENGMANEKIEGWEILIRHILDDLLNT